MKIDNQILITLLLIVAAGILAGAVQAKISDTETSSAPGVDALAYPVVDTGQTTYHEDSEEYDQIYLPLFPR